MSDFGPFAMRLFLAMFLVFTVYQTLMDETRVLERNVNQSIGFYSNKFNSASDFSKLHPFLSGQLDSLITHGLSLLGVTGAIFLLIGSKNYGGLFATLHAVGMILFSNNFWTPKVDPEMASRNFIISIVELGMALSVLMRVHPAEIPHKM